MTNETQSTIGKAIANPSMSLKEAGTSLIAQYGSKTRDEIEAALCLWEAMLEVRNGRFTSEHWINVQWEEMGTVHMRHWAISAAAYLGKVWNAAPMTDDTRDMLSPFDWEFVPAVLGRMSADWIDHSGPYFIEMVKPDDMARALISEKGATE